MLRVSGYNTSKSFSAPNNYDDGQFNVKDGEVYNFTCVAADTASGLQTFELTLNNIDEIGYYDITCSNPYYIDSLSSTTIKIVTLLNIDNPYSAVLIAGKFKTSVQTGDNLNFNFSPFARDFSSNRSEFGATFRGASSGRFGWVN